MPNTTKLRIKSSRKRKLTIAQLQPHQSNCYLVGLEARRNWQLTSKAIDAKSSVKMELM